MSGDARCPRCGGDFHCGVNDREPCACTRIALEAATLAALRERFEGCLCLRCLAEVSKPLEIFAPAATMRDSF